MSQPFAISKELFSYFYKPETRRAVDHMISANKSSAWIDLSKQEVLSLSKAMESYEKYTAAWLYSRKVQADYYTFIRQLWRESWGSVFSDMKLSGVKKDFLEFNTVEGTWEDTGWNQEVFIRGTKYAYSYIWIGVYIDFDNYSRNAEKVVLWLQFGDEGKICCPKVLKSHTLPEGWKNEFDKDEGEYDFRTAFTLAKKSDGPLLPDMTDEFVADITRFIKKVLKAS